MNGFSFWSWFSCTFRFADLEYHEEQLNGFSYYVVLIFLYLQIRIFAYWELHKSSWRVFHLGPDFHVSPDERKQEKQLGCYNNEVQPVWSKIEMELEIPLHFNQKEQNASSNSGSWKNFIFSSQFLVLSHFTFYFILNVILR